MSNWKEIDSLKDGIEAILYQPADERTCRDEGMLIGKVRRERYGLQVDPSMCGGHDMECELTHPTHWRELPSKP